MNAVTHNVNRRSTNSSAENPDTGHRRAALFQSFASPPSLELLRLRVLVEECTDLGLHGGELSLPAQLVLFDLFGGLGDRVGVVLGVDVEAMSLSAAGTANCASGTC